MSSNETDSDPVIRTDCEERETFPIYLLSFVYSLLAVSLASETLKVHNDARGFVVGHRL